MRFDLHIHSKYSYDGIMEPERIIKIAIERGLDGIAITDHNTIKGGLEAKKYEREDFRVIIGSEVSTEKGEIIGLFLCKEIEVRDAQGVIAEIKQQGGIVVIPHPFDRLRHSAFHPTGEYVEFIDAIEGFNSRCVFGRDNGKAIEFAQRHNLPAIAGSDAHYSNEIGKGGVIIGTNDVREAILRGDTKIFGKRSSLLNHVRTKMLKSWRKANLGGIL